MKLKHPREPGLMAAISVAGSLSAIARIVGITPQAVAGWKQIPLERIPVIEGATGLPRHILRADYFVERQYGCVEGVNYKHTPHSGAVSAR